MAGTKLLALLLLGSLLGVTDSVPPIVSYEEVPPMVSYAASIIEYLASQQNEPFVCVFLDYQKDRPFGDFMESLVRLPQFNYMTKFTMTSRYVIENSNVSRAPSLVVLNIGSGLEQPSRNDFHSLAHFNSDVKVLTLVDLSFKRSFDEIIQIFFYLNNNRVIILEPFHKEIMVMNVATMVGFHRLPLPSELFGKPMSNLEGRPITFTSVGGSLKRIQHVFNPLHHWIMECARHLNTSALYVNHKCNRGDTKNFADCYYDQFTAKRVYIMLDQQHITSRASGLIFPFMYFSSVPSALVIMVPRGTIVGTAQLFHMPFSWSVWLVLTGVLLTVQFVHLKRPDLISNDPFLLAVCGFEEFNLSQTGRWEKSVLLPLIVFTFFMSNAYETKFISLMISKPSTQPIRTEEDLIKSGTVIQCDVTLGENSDGRWQLGNLTIHMENWNHDIAMNGIDAYLMTRSSAELNLVLDIGIENQKRSRYVMLEDSFGMALIGVRQIYRNPLESAFRWTEMALVEAGIMDQWTKKYTSDLKKYYIRSIEIDPETEQFLVFKDFMPAWAAIGFGLSIAVAVFVGELAMGLFKKFAIVISKCFEKFRPFCVSLFYERNFQQAYVKSLNKIKGSLNVKFAKRK